MTQLQALMLRETGDLVTAIGFVLAGLNMVKEKEIGNHRLIM
jgi:hypothetical protein